MKGSQQGSTALKETRRAQQHDAPNHFHRRVERRRRKAAQAGQKGPPRLYQ